MAIDVEAEVFIYKPRNEVAEYASNPDNDPVWITGITEANLLTYPPVGLGTRVERVAGFLGRKVEYVLETTEYRPDELVVMTSVKGPFPMKVTYGFEEAKGGTLARIRIEGETTGFYQLAGPIMSRAVKRNITNDLETLKDILESRA